MCGGRDGTSGEQIKMNRKYGALVKYPFEKGCRCTESKKKKCDKTCGNAHNGQTKTVPPENNNQ